MNLLIEAFDTFRKASMSLEGYYKGLEKRVEELNMELAEKTNYLTGIVEGLPVGIIVTGVSGRIETVNSAACAILGSTAGGLKGRNLEDAGVAPQDGRARGPGGDIDGGVIYGRLSEVETETVITGRDGRKRVVTLNSTALENLCGRSTGRLIVLKDVSEVKRLRESAQRDKRLAAMGEMAASLAHQIRNPLGSIDLFASLLSEELSGDEARQRLSKEIVHAVKTLNNTLSNMLLFANNSRPFKTIVFVKELLDETAGMCGFLIQDSVRIETRCEAPAAYIFVDRELMKQALSNLVMNGVEALTGREGGAVSITALKHSDSVHILVSDNGCGIPRECLDKVFDPFFTTKSKGTGLGLTIVNNIVKAHGGVIEAESPMGNGGEGATFEIILPEGEAHA